MVFSDSSRGSQETRNFCKKASKNTPNANENCVHLKMFRKMYAAEKSLAAAGLFLLLRQGGMPLKRKGKMEEGAVKKPF